MAGFGRSHGYRTNYYITSTSVQYLYGLINSMQHTVHLHTPSCLALSTAGWSAALLPELLLLLEELDESLLLDLLPLLAELLLLLELLERDELLEELKCGAR